MSELFETQLEIDRKKVKDAVRLQLPIELTTYTLPRNMEVYFRKVLQIFLEECHETQLYDYLNFCLGELLTNSKKANTKRVYFKEKNLNINNPDDYAKGMESFMQDTFSDIDRYLEMQKKEGLYVKLSLQLSGENIIVQIKNNSVLTTFEKQRIQKKLDSVQQYDNIDDVVSNVIDQSEGAGLGIIIIVLMLQKAGLSKENYQVFSTDKETITKIILPCNQKLYASEDILAHEFVKLQKTVPVDKDGFDAIKAALKAEDKKAVFNVVSKNPMLALLLVKTLVDKKIDNFDLNHAVDVLSFEDFNKIYSEDNPLIRLVPTNQAMLDCIDHSVAVAFNSFNLAKNGANGTIELSPEELYTYGLLNSFGGILVEARSEEQEKVIEKVADESEQKDVVKDVFTGGNVNTYISMLFMQSLGMPENLYMMVAFWNNRSFISPGYENASKVIYLGEVMRYCYEGLVEFFQVDSDICSFFNIKDETQFNYIINQLKVK